MSSNRYLLSIYLFLLLFLYRKLSPNLLDSDMSYLIDCDTCYPLFINCLLSLLEKTRASRVHILVE